METSRLADAVPGLDLSKAEYEARLPALRIALVNAQYEVTQQRDFAVLILLAGMSGSGRSETANRLNEWMDPRHVHLRAFEQPGETDRERPLLWRYWQALPPKGSIGVMLDAWYHAPVMRAAAGKATEQETAHRLADIRDFETLLRCEGVLLVKLWFHLNEAKQRERLAQLDADKLTRWRVTDDDRWQLKHYARFSAAAEHVLRETGSELAPWRVIDGSDAEYRDMAVGNLLLEAMRERLASPSAASSGPAAPTQSAEVDTDALRRVDLSTQLDKSDYEPALAQAQAALAQQTRRKRFRKRAMVVVFEGVDAAGKGSTIRRVTYALDVRQYSVVPIAAPSEEELRYPWLWRFWRNLPRRGGITIFDRSWYGRVLVERVEKLCAPADWQRAYAEINSFERQLAESDVVIAKFWLQISKGEQLKRFRAREETPFKRFKLTEDDWRNRRKWNAYQEAATEMIARTSSDIAPWHIIEAEDKYYARVKVLRTLTESLEHALG